MADWMRNMERRLAALESSVPLARSSMRGGSMRYLTDDADKELAIFGDFGAEGLDIFKGFLMRDSDQITVIGTRSDQKGLVKPVLPGQFALASAVEPVTSGSFVQAAFYTPMEVYHEVLRVIVFITTPGGTTGEIKLVEGVSLRSTDVVTIPSGANGFARFEWIHEVEKGDNGRFTCQFQLHCRRTAGAGTISVHQPDEVAWACHFDVPAATTAGNVAWL